MVLNSMSFANNISNIRGAAEFFFLTNLEVLGYLMTETLYRVFDIASQSMNNS